MILRNPATIEAEGHTLWCHGNQAHLGEPLTAVLCSRACPGAKIIEAIDLAQQWRAENRSVISGFHTPVERECLRIFLRGPQHIVICPARGLDPFELPTEWKSKFDRNELLIISPFDSSIRRPTKDTAALRTGVVLELATERKVVYASPGGMLDRFSKCAHVERFEPKHR